MAGKGGARPGAGRKSQRDEDKARRLCIAAIEFKYGSLEKGLVKLLESDEPSLQKFVFEHAIGKPTDKIDLGEGQGNVYVFELPSNGRERSDYVVKASNGNGHHTS
jgi:hypothetical protein